MKHPSKGFTLIELLVVIAIIGILATIVLAFMSGTNNKARDKKTLQQVSSMRSQASLYTGTLVVVPPTTGTSMTVASNLFGDAVVANNSLYRLINGLPSGTTYYYAWDGIAPGLTGKWFFAATQTTGTVCVDWKSTIKVGTIVVTTPATIANWTTVGAGQAGYTNLTVAGGYSCS